MGIISRLIALFFLTFSIVANAAVTSWKIVQDKSEIAFTATQNGSPVSGKFKKFNGDIKFDPVDLKGSSVTIIVDMNSVTTSYADVGNTLKTPDWFDTKSFPEATFKATEFINTSKDSYLANGTLTIRDKVTPIVLTFKLDQYTKTNAHVTGSTMLKRLALGVGRGEWEKTDSIKDDVQINFTVTAVAQ